MLSRIREQLRRIEMLFYFHVHVMEKREKTSGPVTEGRYQGRVQARAHDCSVVALVIHAL